MKTFNEIIRLCSVANQIVIITFSYAVTSSCWQTERSFHTVYQTVIKHPLAQLAQLLVVIVLKLGDLDVVVRKSTINSRSI